MLPWNRSETVLVYLMIEHTNPSRTIKESDTAPLRYQDRILRTP